MNASRSAAGQSRDCRPAETRLRSEGSSAIRWRRSSEERLGWMLQTRSSRVVTAPFHASLSSPAET